jgi:hypothetical protein
MLLRSRSLRTLITALVSVALIAGVAGAAPGRPRLVRSAARVRGGRRATARVIGQVTPARVIWSLLRTRSGQAALIRPASTLAASVRPAANSAITLALR